jgi:hypothetical protein
MDRQELVADWRKRLAAAESMSEAPSQRLSWLIRVRLRLYRFLLSLYGDGDWSRTPGTDAGQSADSHKRGVVFHSASVLPLDGKPARSGDKIRAVLEAVASHQDHALPVGPLVNGLPADYWSVVAARSDGIDTEKCRRLLISRGLTPRVTPLRRDRVIEVPAGQHSEASAIIAAHREELLRPPPVIVVRRPVPRHWQLIGIAVLLFLLSLPLAWMFTVLWFSVAISVGHQIDPLADVTIERFIIHWAGIYLIIAEILLLYVCMDRRPKADGSR